MAISKLVTAVLMIVRPCEVGFSGRKELKIDITPSVTEPHQPNMLYQESRSPFFVEGCRRISATEAPVALPNSRTAICMASATVVLF